jgi:hydrogenase expression/formation protein HypC
MRDRIHPFSNSRDSVIFEDTVIIYTQHYHPVLKSLLSGPVHRAPAASNQEKIMCLSIPGKVISIENDIATVSVGGSEVQAGLQLLDDVKIGDYVLVHSGFALQLISEEEAARTLELIRELEDLADDESPM